MNSYNTNRAVSPASHCYSCARPIKVGQPGLNKMAVQYLSLLLFLLFYHISSSFGQNGVLQHQWLLQMEQGKAASFLRANFPTPVRTQLVSKSMNIWLLETEAPDLQMQAWARQFPEIIQIQKNLALQSRNGLEPNDPLYPLQWQYKNTGANGGLSGADLQAPAAWGITTGGVTAAGDTIVVAVIDNGINPAHADLASNLWKNRAEIPNDGIDNDQNGYVDDYAGWNVFSSNDQIQGSTTLHGSAVSGIIGASGNNGTGISGVNWNVKMMFVAAGNTLAEALAAYDYVIQARSRYNETNGASGAFVVAVNASWGSILASQARRLCGANSTKNWAKMVFSASPPQPTTRWMSIFMATCPLLVPVIFW